MYQVSVGAVQFQYIEACLLCPTRALGEVIDESADFRDGQFLRRWDGTERNVAGTDTSPALLDVASTFPRATGGCFAACMHQLNADGRSVIMEEVNYFTVGACLPI